VRVLGRADHLLEVFARQPQRGVWIPRIDRNASRRTCRSRSSRPEGLLSVLLPYTFTLRVKVSEHFVLLGIHCPESENAYNPKQIILGYHSKISTVKESIIRIFVYLNADCHK
jgi:hypothetical protein